MLGIRLRQRKHQSQGSADREEWGVRRETRGESHRAVRARTGKSEGVYPW